MDKHGFVSLLRDRLACSDIAEQWNTSREVTPTRYAILDDLLPPDLARSLYRAFPANDAEFTLRDSFRERKRTSVSFDALPQILAAVTFAFQDLRISRLISDRVGIEGMDGDPTLYAGGLSIMRQGDFLNPHIDNSHEATKRRYRRVNLLYYVTPDFSDDVGGNLELWDAKVRAPVTLHSRFNRLILMETNRTSWHSVSPIHADVARCCVSSYYFSPCSPTGHHYYHVTSFTGRPDQKVRRAAGLVDNRLRQAAREVLGISRASDAGYRGYAS